MLKVFSTTNYKKYTYFICNYDEAKKDCDNNYNLEEFNKLLLDKNLPEFNYTKNSNDLIFMEWIKRKISFQKTPPSPFWEDPEQNTEKILEPIKYFTTLILFTFSVFTYGTPYILLALILLLFLFGYLFIEKRQKHKNNN